MPFYFLEFYSTLICNDNIEDFKDVCASFKEVLKINEEYIKKSIREKAATQPKWHMVDMFYKQLDGMKAGFLAKYQENNEEIGSEDFDLEHGFLRIFSKKYTTQASFIFAPRFCVKQVLRKK